MGLRFPLMETACLLVLFTSWLAGEMLSDAEFQAYCNKMASTPAWGGQVELQAMATVLKRPIEVIQAEGPPMVVGEQFKQSALVLTYHRHAYGLGEHYNSVQSCS